jgi:hypothetical protein
MLGHRRRIAGQHDCPPFPNRGVIILMGDVEYRSPDYFLGGIGPKERETGGIDENDPVIAFDMD